MDCLISIGTGLSAAEQSRTDHEAEIKWQNKIFNIIQTGASTQLHVEARAQERKHFYQRLDPDLTKLFKTDKTSKENLQQLLEETTSFIVKNVDFVKEMCRQLVALLLYVSDIKRVNESSQKILIQSRQQPFRVSGLIEGPNWNILCHVLNGTCRTEVKIYHPEAEPPSSEQLSSERPKLPLAEVYVTDIKTECTLEIFVLIGEKKYRISGGKVTLQFSPQ